MTVKGSKTKLKIKKARRSVIKSNNGTPLGGTKRNGKVVSYEGLSPIGGSLPPTLKKIKSNTSTPIGGSKQIAATKGPRVKKSRTK